MTERVLPGIALPEPSGVAQPAVSQENGDAAEEELVRRAQAGDRLAFGDLYRRYAGMVHGVLLARVDRIDVADLVQDVFLAAMGRLDTLQHPAAFAGWLCAIARNRATDHARRRVAREVPLDDRLPSRDPDRSEAVAVLGIVRSLPEAYRETLILRFVEGMTGPEIAARTGMTPGSVRVNLHRGMKLLRERLRL